MITPTNKRDREVFELVPPKKILVYQDQGTSVSSLQAIITQLQNTIQEPFTTKIVNSRYLLTKKWEVKTFALIMGGGHCTHWENALGDAGMHIIKRFVANGGRYLGICAGAYFAAATSTFQLQGQAPITKLRPLAFYQGQAVGPIAKTTDHLSLQAAKALKIELLSKKGRCYYLGGCSFDITEDYGSTRVLALYTKPYYGSAIISCAVEKGRAVLCGLHPEFLWHHSLASEQTLDEFKNLVQKLSPEESFRQEIWSTMLKEFT